MQTLLKFYYKRILKKGQEHKMKKEEIMKYYWICKDAEKDTKGAEHTAQFPRGIRERGILYARLLRRCVFL